ALSDRARARLFLERLEGRADHVVRVGRADRLGDDVGNAEAFENRAHRAAGDDSGGGRSRTERNAARAEMADAVVMKRAAVAQRNANHRLLGCGGRLADRFWHFTCLAVAENGAAPALGGYDARSGARD